MSNFKKLSRPEMKNLLGGVFGCGCKGECVTYNDCPGQQTCESEDCNKPGASCKWMECVGKI